MSGRRWQERSAKVFVAMVIFAAGVVARADAPGDLRASCDAMLAAAIKRPYGIGWQDAPLDKPAQRVPVSFTAMAAGGLVLHLAANELGEPRYEEAAMKVARALATAQEPTGRVPQRGQFAATSIGRDDPSLLTERTGTRAAMGLWLTILDGQKDRDPRIAGAAKRASYWLLKRQNPVAIWLTQTREDSHGPLQSRINLVDGDYRDSTLAMLLAWRVFGDNALRLGADRAVDELIHLRVNGPYPIWTDLYDGGGSPKDEELHGVDLLATRVALQTLFAYSLATDEAHAGTVLTDSAKVAASMKKENGRWPERYTPGRLSAIGVFTAPNEGMFGLPETLRAIDDARVLTNPKYVNLLNSQFKYNEHLALAMVGLSDLPLLDDFPVGSAEVAPYMANHQSLTTAATDPSAPDLMFRARRLYAALIRAQLELRVGKLRRI